MAKLWVKTIRPSTALEREDAAAGRGVAGADHEEDRQHDDEDDADHPASSIVIPS